MRVFVDQLLGDVCCVEGKLGRIWGLKEGTLECLDYGDAYSEMC